MLLKYFYFKKVREYNIVSVLVIHTMVGKTWFAVEAKTFEISIEEKSKKLRGCIWERCKGATSWVRFGESSLQRLLLGIEDCDMISRNQDWFANWEEEGRCYKLERRSNNAGNFLYECIMVTWN